jgi:hypothetical protein
VEAAIFGFPRLRVTDGGLSLRPLLLGGGATSHALRGVAYLGNTLDISYDGQSITLSVAGAVTPGLLADGARALTAGSGGFPFRSVALDALRSRLAGALPLAEPAPGDDGRGAFNASAPSGAFGGRAAVDPRNPAASVRDVLAGRPWLGGRAYPVAQRPLVVVDGASVARPLPASGAAVVLPLGPVTIVDAADWVAVHPSPAPSPSAAPASPSATPSPSAAAATVAAAAPQQQAPGAAPAPAPAAAAGNATAVAGTADASEDDDAAAALRQLLRRRRERREQRREDGGRGREEEELAALLASLDGEEEEEERDGGDSDRGGKRKHHGGRGRRKKHHGKGGDDGDDAGSKGGDGKGDGGGDDDEGEDADELEALLARAVLGRRKKRGHGGGD